MKLILDSFDFRYPSFYLIKKYKLGIYENYKIKINYRSIGKIKNKLIEWLEIKYFFITFTFLDQSWVEKYCEN